MVQSMGGGQAELVPSPMGQLGMFFFFFFFLIDSPVCSRVGILQLSLYSPNAFLDDMISSRQSAR